MAAQDSQLGRLLSGRYRIDELIGRGGMSTVYRGFDTQLHRPVAIKIFQHGEDDDELRWESEVRLLSQLSHPHLVTLHDAHLAQSGSAEVNYLVMEYVPGSNLQLHLAETGPSVPLAALVLTQIGEALGSVHSRGIIHRDLKPGNILIEPSELPPLHLRTKLADFGIAHLLGSDRVTRTGTMIGTAAYTSPEQVNRETATPASDVYSLGLVAIECISGRPAFPGAPTESLIARLARDPTTPPGLPSEWTVLLASMTARDPALRPTALEAALRSRELAPLSPDVIPVDQAQRMLPPTMLLPAVHAARPPEGSAATVLLPTNSESPTRRQPRRPRRPVIIGLVAVAMALILGATALSSQPTGNISPTGPPSPDPKATSTFTTPSPSPTPTTQVPATSNGHGHGEKGHG